MRTHHSCQWRGGIIAISSLSEAAAENYHLTLNGEGHFTLDAEVAGDYDFGTQEEGGWTISVEWDPAQSKEEPESPTGVDWMVEWSLGHIERVKTSEV